MSDVKAFLAFIEVGVPAPKKLAESAKLVLELYKHFPGEIFEIGYNDVIADLHRRIA